MATPLASNAAPRDLDVRLWPAIAITSSLGEHLQLKADALMETSATGNPTGLQLVRVVVVRPVSERLAVGGGYTQVWGRSRSGASYIEYRAVQELSLRLAGDYDGVLLTSRTRLEERHSDRGPALALRLRHQTRLELPLALPGVRAVMWNEYFHSLNGTSWSGPAGPALMLNFAGARLPISQKVSIEPGYLNQTTLGPGRSQTSHVAAVTVAVQY